jgi:hypothetical protein
MYEFGLYETMAEAGAFNIMDCSYIDFDSLYHSSVQRSAKEHGGVSYESIWLVCDVRYLLNLHIAKLC